MFASKDVFLKSSSGGYTIARSVRLRSSASAYLNRTFSAGNRKTYTISFWMKRGKLATQQFMFTGFDGTTSANIQFTSGDLLALSVDGNVGYQITSSQVFRDPSAWYHFVFAVDTTQATAANRLKMYVNGSQITALTSSSYPPQNHDTYFFGAFTHWIGASQIPSLFTDGYATEFNAIDGQALTPSSFGATDATTGVWQPTRYTGTYGTNGFYLNFSSNSTAAALGTDFSGNSNTWTVNNISVTAGTTYDSMTDVPTLTSATTANYAVLNPLAMYGTSAVISNANLTSSATGGPSNRGWPSTIAAPGSGKWYAEFTFTATDSGNNGGCGIMLENGTGSPGESATTVVWLDAATIRQNASGTSYGTALSVNDVVMVAYDAGLGRVWFGRNGTWFASGDPATNANPSATGITTSGRFATYHFSTAAVIAANFGQRPFTYTPPSGFVALNTFNLSTPTIPNGAVYFAATTYTGTGATQVVTNTVNGTAMQPDWVWQKSRSAARDHRLMDTNRGINLVVCSDLTQVEYSGSILSSVNSNGFTLNTADQGNNNGETYVAWQWKANAGTNVSNTSGSITSTVSANTTAGFSVVTYTGTGVAATIGHGLNVAPSMVIVKQRNATADWVVKHASLSSNDAALILNNASASTVYSPSVWNNTAPTSTVFSIGTNSAINTNTNTYVAYVFAAVAGYSAFGSYTGNGSTDGPFVFLGFRPRFVLFKRTDSTDDWILFDTSRNTYDVMNSTLFPNGNYTETTDSNRMIDALSNGFKVRSSPVYINASGGTYIYMAFAENPFKYSLAR